MRHQRLTHAAALGLAVAALAAPTAAAQHQDLRSPDTRDAARSLSTGAGQQRDLRSPDTRDYANGRGTFNAPEVTVVRLPQSAPAQRGGIDWGDAGIGAGSLLAVILLGLASTFAVLHRRRGDRRQIATTG
jgi:hypothetical protein